MKTYSSIFFCILFFIGCSTANKPILIGQTIAYSYGSDVYHLTFDTDTTLHWEAIVGNEKGLKGTEKYSSDWIDNNLLFITWAENNGTGVSQILNFKKGSVKNHLLHGRQATKGDGKIKIIE